MTTTDGLARLRSIKHENYHHLQFTLFSFFHTRGTLSALTPMLCKWATIGGEQKGGEKCSHDFSINGSRKISFTFSERENVIISFKWSSPMHIRNNDEPLPLTLKRSSWSRSVKSALSIQRKYRERIWRCYGMLFYWYHYVFARRLMFVDLGIRIEKKRRRLNRPKT